MRLVKFFRLPGEVASVVVLLSGGGDVESRVRWDMVLLSGELWRVVRWNGEWVLLLSDREWCFVVTRSGVRCGTETSG